jgi:ABC-type transport system involved in cytochrome bd biosynthesis fused ATPase/permease subunit
VLIITHRPVNFPQIDDMALMDQGRIVASGAHEILMRTEPRYCRMIAKMV